MTVPPLKYLLIIQNFVCVFRNFSSFRKYSRILICAWIIIESALILFNITLNIVMEDFGVSRNLFLDFFSLFVIGFSIAIIILPVYHSDSFQHLTLNFNTFHDLFKGSSYSLKLIKVQKRITIIVVLIFLVKILVFVYIPMSFPHLDTNPNTIAKVVYLYSMLMWQFRFTLEYLVLDCLLLVISEQLNTLTQCLEDDLSVTYSKNKNKDEVIASTPEDSFQKFYMWTAAYKNVSSSSSLFNAIYSTQVTTQNPFLFIFILYF